MMGSGSYKGGSRYDNTSVVISGKMRTAEEATKKAVWVWTKNKDVMTASVEGGWTTFVFTPDTKELANQWTCVFSALPIAALKNIIHMFAAVIERRLASCLSIFFSCIIRRRKVPKFEFGKFEVPPPLLLVDFILVDKLSVLCLVGFCSFG